jgi:prolipoprotein diacylglyceryltransferase
MRPVLIDLWGFDVPTHEAFVAMGLAVAGAVYLWEARRRNTLNEATLWVAVGALIGGALFAKVGSAWRFVGTGSDLSELYLFGGRTILGGLAGAYFGALVAKRLVGYTESTGGLFAPAVAIGLGVGRVGCFLTEQVGTPTSLPWGVHVSQSAAATIENCPQCVGGQPMHPSFLYESAFLCIVFVVLWATRNGPVTDAMRFKLFLLSYGVFRFLVEFVRGNPDMAFGLSGSQLFLLATVPMLLLVIVRGLPSRPSTNPLQIASRA